jgi:hypothetical protein
MGCAIARASSLHRVSDRDGFTEEALSSESLAGHRAAGGFEVRNNTRSAVSCIYSSSYKGLTPNYSVARHNAPFALASDS